MMDTLEARAKGAMIGVGIGDALGGALEFMSRAEIQSAYGSYREITGGGHWQLAPGEVTDDTDMTIALAKGILENPSDPIEAIARYFKEWALTEPKDIGKICRLVLQKGIRSESKTEEEWVRIAAAAHEQSGGRSGGNGSLMRTVPVVIAYHRDSAFMENMAFRQSALTHYDPIAGACTAYYCRLLRELLLDNLGKSGKLNKLGKAGEASRRLIADSLKDAPVDLRIDLATDKIKTSGYVVHTLEAALNCIYQTDSFEDALIMAVNLGGDTDTIGAVTGGMAGAIYGIEQIPDRWLKKLIVKEELLELTNRLLAIMSFCSTR